MGLGLDEGRQCGVVGEVSGVARYGGLVLGSGKDGLVGAEAGQGGPPERDAGEAPLGPRGSASPQLFWFTWPTWLHILVYLEMVELLSNNVRTIHSTLN